MSHEQLARSLALIGDLHFHGVDKSLRKSRKRVWLATFRVDGLKPISADPLADALLYMPTVESRSGT